MKTSVYAAAGAAGLLTLASLAASTASSAAPAVSSSPRSILAPLRMNTRVASTVPGNGDLNPYGVAVVPRSVRRLHRGDVLVSNFNDRRNLQGTGTTIVALGRGGHHQLFARIASAPGCPGGVGLTTALGVTRGGWVVVGSLPTRDGTAATARAGCLLVLDSRGQVREVLAGHGINGPWDMTLTEHGAGLHLYVTNVLNGTVAGHGRAVHRGTVLRLDLRLRGARPPQWVHTTVIGSGFPERSDPAALVIGPTGVALGGNGSLYVADTAGNRLTRIPDAAHRTRSAGTGHTVRAGGALRGPLGLAISPHGDLVSANAGNGNLVETSPSGRRVAVRTVDTSGMPKGAGALFGLAIPSSHAVFFVDDATNTLQLLH